MAADSSSSKKPGVIGCLVVLAIIVVISVICGLTLDDYEGEIDYERTDEETWQSQQELFEYCIDKMVDLGLTPRVDGISLKQTLRSIKDPSDTQRLYLGIQCIEAGLIPTN